MKDKEDLAQIVENEFQQLSSLYFNAAYFGPSPKRAEANVQAALKREMDPSFYPYKDWSSIPDRVRKLIAQVLQVPSESVCHVTSASDVVSLVANGYPFKPGDVVCTVKRDYPSNVLPWMLAEKYGQVKLRQLTLGPQEIPTRQWLEKNLPKETKIFDISHVSFESGKRVDLVEIGEFLRSRNILFIVDVTQSLGGLKLTSKELGYIDVLACSSYKWMLGPYGHAFAYFSEKALNLLEHRNAYWLNTTVAKEVENLVNYTIESLPGARRFDRGQCPNMLAMSCLEAGLDLLLEVGLEWIEAHNAHIRNMFLENFPKQRYEVLTPKEHMGNIICIKSKEDDSFTLEKKLKAANIDVSVREGNLRLSFHLFNTEKQVEQLIKTLS